MLSRDRAPELHAQLEDLRTEAIGAAPLTRYVRVEQNERVQIAITSVENVHTSQPVLGLHLLDGLEHAPDVFARDRAVHAVIVRRNAPRRWKRILAPRPEAQALRLRT